MVSVVMHRNQSLTKGMHKCGNMLSPTVNKYGKTTTLYERWIALFRNLAFEKYSRITIDKSFPEDKMRMSRQ